MSKIEKIKRMKKLLFIFPLIITINSYSQRPSNPVWPESYSEFKTAKISTYNTVTKKHSSAVYNDGLLVIEQSTDGSDLKIKIDINNKFFMKNGVFSVKGYKQEDGFETFTYLATEGEKYVSVTFYYNDGESSPFEIQLVGTDKITSKTGSRFSYLLTEFK
jgi:hypothetical protein